MSERVIKAPAPLRATRPHDPPSVFLAGSIEMGKAVDWQTEITALLLGMDERLVVYNPRRDDWDSSWVQSIENPQFREQVSWELDAMEQADAIAMHFEPGTQSPITLLELGLSAPSKLVVHCSPGFWRKGNVDIVCQRRGVMMCPTLAELAATAATVAARRARGWRAKDASL